MNTSRLISVDGVVYALVPAEEAAAIGRVYERSSDLTRLRSPSWRPDPATARAARVMRSAVQPGADIEAFGSESRVMGSLHDARMLPTTEAAERLNVTPARVRQLCAAGAFPGARRHRGGWAIPAGDIDNHHRRDRT